MRLKMAVCASNSSQGAAVARAWTVKRGATIADLASEFLARMSGSAGAGDSVVVVPTPTDPAGIRRCARDLKTWSATQKNTNVERGGSRDPGARRPGAGRGQLPARSKIFRAISIPSFFVISFFHTIPISHHPLLCL